MKSTDQTEGVKRLPHDLCAWVGPCGGRNHHDSGILQPTHHGEHAQLSRACSGGCVRPSVTDDTSLRVHRRHASSPQNLHTHTAPDMTSQSV